MMKYILVLTMLFLTACGSSPERRAAERKAFLTQHKAFATETTRPRLRALASGSTNECEQAVNPLIEQAKAAIGDLDGVQSGANQTLNAATGGNAAAIAAMLAAAAAQQQNQQPSTNTPTASPPRAIVQPSVVDPVAAVPAPELGSGGFQPSPHPPTTGNGGATNGDSTVAHVEGGPGSRDGITGGVAGGGSTGGGGGGSTGGGGGGRDTIVGGTGGRGNDAIVGQVQANGADAHAEIARTNIGSLATEGGGGGGSSAGLTFAGGNYRDELLPPSALAGRAPASRVAGLAAAADVATKYGPGIFSLTTQTYSRFCVRQNIGTCSGL